MCRAVALQKKKTRRRWNKSQLTCLSVSRAVYRRSLPSRLNNACGLSRIMKTMSAGILPRDWSPSFWNVTFVPDFQPGFIDILTSLSSFFDVPSSLRTRREIFIFLTQPLLISSSVTLRSCSMGGSCVFSFFNGECTLKEWDLQERDVPNQSVLPQMGTILQANLNAGPSPCRLPKPPNGEKKSVSVSKSNRLFFSNGSDMSKNDANGLLEPKNWANVARGSPWNWYEKLLVVFGPLDCPGKIQKDIRDQNPHL